jgi:fatty acid desaturase
MPKYDETDLNLRISDSDLKRLSQVSPHKHFVQIILNWVIIFTSIYLCTHYFNPFSYLFAVVIIGTRMHVLGVLGHESTHYLFLKNRKWNDFIANVTCMYPLFNSIENYRASHFNHHQYTNTSEDPDWAAKENKEEYEFPKTKKAFFFTLVMYVFFIQGIKDIRWMLQRIKKNTSKQTLSLKKRVLKISFYLLLVLLLTISNGWVFYLAFWVVPFSTFFFLFMYIRSVAEHFALSRECLLTSTRTIKASLLE